MFLLEHLTRPAYTENLLANDFITSWRAPGSANTHQTNCHRNDVYQAICLKLSMLVCIKLIANIR